MDSMINSKVTTLFLSFGMSEKTVKKHTDTFAVNQLHKKDTSTMEYITSQWYTVDNDMTHIYVHMFTYLFTMSGSFKLSEKYITNAIYTDK